MTKASTAQKSTPILKGRNAPSLWTFMAVNVAVFLSLVAVQGFSAASFEEFWSRIGIKNGALAVLIPLVTIVLGNLVSSPMKARIVFWRWRFPLPGCRIFTDLMHSDHRVDQETLTRKLGKLPEAPIEQNVLWFRLYKKHASVPVIADAQRVYLLLRDMAAIAAMFLLFLPVGAVLGSVDVRTAGLYGAALLFQYILLAIAARNAGNRFALHVLVEEAHK